MEAQDGGRAGNDSTLGGLQVTLPYPTHSLHREFAWVQALAA